MRAERQEMGEAVPVVGLEAWDQGAVVVPVGRVVEEEVETVALPTTGHRSLRHYGHRSR
jgi:hypothetical protein